MRFSFNQLERLFASHHREFFVAALSVTRNGAAAEDVVHDALLAVAALDKPPENMKAYLFRVIRNKALLANKEAQRAESVGLELDYLNALSLKEFDGEQRLFLEQAIAKMESLEVNQQQVLLLKFFADLSFREIAEVMDCPLNTVSSWYRRGLQQLQENLNEQ